MPPWSQENSSHCEGCARGAGDKAFPEPPCRHPSVLTYVDTRQDPPPAVMDNREQDELNNLLAWVHHLGLGTSPWEQNWARKNEGDHKNNCISQKTRLGYNSDLECVSPKPHALKVWSSACGTMGRWWRHQEAGLNRKKLNH